MRGFLLACACPHLCCSGAKHANEVQVTSLELLQRACGLPQAQACCTRSLCQVMLSLQCIWYAVSHDWWVRLDLCSALHVALIAKHNGTRDTLPKVAMT